MIPTECRTHYYRSVIRTSLTQLCEMSLFKTMLILVICKAVIFQVALAAATAYDSSDLSHTHNTLHLPSGSAHRNQNETFSPEELKNYNSFNEYYQNKSKSSINRNDNLLNPLLLSITNPPFPIPLHDNDIGFAIPTSQVPESTLEIEPTEPPVKGAIDYVLLPLLFMGVAGPLFVVMYVVVAAIESKLPPNNQLRADEGKHLQTHYLDMSSIFENAQPVLSILMSSMSRAIDSDQCKEKVACMLGSYTRNLRTYSWFQYVENAVLMFVPRRFAKSYNAVMAKSDGLDEKCVNYYCTFIS